MFVNGVVIQTLEGLSLNCSWLTWGHLFNLYAAVSVLVKMELIIQPHQVDVRIK